MRDICVPQDFGMRHALLADGHTASACTSYLMLPGEYCARFLTGHADEARLVAELHCLRSVASPPAALDDMPMRASPPGDRQARIALAFRMSAPARADYISFPARPRRPFSPAAPALPGSTALFAADDDISARASRSAARDGRARRTDRAMPISRRAA